MPTLFLANIQVQIVARNRAMAEQLLLDNIKSKKHDDDYGLVGFINCGMTER